MKLVIKDKGRYHYDLVSLGEVMLRFDPGEHRIRNTRTFRVWEGGGEYNVARGLKSCFNKNTAIVTALVDNEVGRLVQARIRAGGVHDAWIRWMPDDGIGVEARNGIYFWESGFGIRNGAGTSDRGHTAVSQLTPGDIDWEELFTDHDVRWFHTGGIFAGLSESTSEVCAVAMQAARKHGAIVSYDLNYRPSVWKRRGGKDEADRVNGRLLDYADVLFGVNKLDSLPGSLDSKPFEAALLRMVERHPNLKAAATTMRIVKNATVNDWSGLLWMDNRFYQGMQMVDLEIMDRVGAGDAFATGLIHGLLESKPPAEAIEYAVAHGALVMTTPGDNSMVSQTEVESIMQSGQANINR